MIRPLSSLLIIIVLAAGCGVPVDREAKAVSDVPFGLLDLEQVESPEDPGPPEGLATQIYLVDPSGNLLVGVERRLADTSLPSVVDSLLSGPTRAESRDGLSSAFPDQPGLINKVELVEGVAGIDLAQSFTSSEGIRQRLSIAQLVLTLTARPGVGRVSFTLEGQPIDVPRGDGTLAAGSVSRDSYRELMGTLEE